MGFKMPKDAREYFKLIDRGNFRFKIMYDKYFICLMMGLKCGRLGSSEQLESGDFLDYYPELYADKSDLIIGLLIDAEMRRQGIVAEDRPGVESLILKLISHNSNTRLSEQGVELLNLYAAYGLDVIRDKITKTAELETFLVHYYNLINSAS
ncbi:hypothetical protein [Paenibacillus elgii]|uniref:hypothetical protein n=1 Tax=Paenibacillus elgii TaxID=189691 RepID=UPI0013D1A333|nr:hypothetical protein [Paenibacillus elgii]